MGLLPEGGVGRGQKGTWRSPLRPYRPANPQAEQQPTTQRRNCSRPRTDREGGHIETGPPSACDGAVANGKYGLSHLTSLSFSFPITKTGHDSGFYLIMCILWKANEIQNNNNASGVCVCVCECVCVWVCV